VRIEMTLTWNIRGNAFRLIGSWFAFLLYAGAFTPLGLGVAAGAGFLDRTHLVCVQGGEHGSQIVLKHGNKCAMHRHGVVARALTLFAQPVSAANPDHVIQFNSPDTFSRQAEVSVPRPGNFAQPVVGSIEAARGFRHKELPPLGLIRRSLDQCRPPLLLRSTLLLI
jgi:hypothetical protein